MKKPAIPTAKSCPSANRRGRGTLFLSRAESTARVARRPGKWRAKDGGMYTPNDPAERTGVGIPSPQDDAYRGAAQYQVKDK